MPKYHWSNDETAKFGEFFLEHRRQEALFAIYGDGDDLVDPDGAAYRLREWWESQPIEQRRPDYIDLYVRWGEIVEAVLRGFAPDARYFSEFVADGLERSFRLEDGEPNHRNIWVTVKGEVGGRYDHDSLSITYQDVSTDSDIVHFSFEVPDRTTVAYLSYIGVDHVENSLGIFRNRLSAEFLPHALLTLARMGVSIVRWETHGANIRYLETVIKETGGRWLSLPDGRYQTDRVLAWWSLRSYDSSQQAEKALWGAREANRTDSGFHFSETQFGRPYGETWHIIYQTGYDDTYSQVNMDYMIKELTKVDPDGEWWQIEWYSGMGTGRMLVVRAYDDAGNLSEVYQQVREWTDYVRDHYPLLDEDEFFKREAAYIREQIKERIDAIHDQDEDTGRVLLPGHPDIENELVDLVWEELTNNRWGTGNIDDFVLEEGQVLTALANLKMIDPQQYDEFEFCPIDYTGWSKWGDLRRRRRDYKPERVFPTSWIGEAHPLLEWAVRQHEQPLKFELVWTIGETEGLVVTDETSYRMTEPLPLHLGEDVWFSWKVRAILPDNVPTEWGQGWTYSMFQARTGKQSPDAA